MPLAPVPSGAKAGDRPPPEGRRRRFPRARREGIGAGREAVTYAARRVARPRDATKKERPHGLSRDEHPRPVGTDNPDHRREQRPRIRDRACARREERGRPPRVPTRERSRGSDREDPERDPRREARIPRARSREPRFREEGRRRGEGEARAPRRAREQRGRDGLPDESKTKDGFEAQLGTNHLGHFALTLQLLPPAREERCAARRDRDEHDAQIRRDRFRRPRIAIRVYVPSDAYTGSKLANLLFTYELSRRLASKQASTIAVSSHPGYAATNLQGVGPKMEESGFMETMTDVANALVAQSAASGALPSLYAATAGDVASNDYYGPGVLAMWGAPAKSSRSAAAKDGASAKQLWEASARRPASRISSDRRTERGALARGSRSRPRRCHRLVAGASEGSRHIDRRFPAGRERARHHARAMA